MLAGIDLPSSSRALVAVASEPCDAHPHRSIQCVPSFLAHMIATARQFPQTRERRRADAKEVIAAYRATVERLQRLDE
jgi:hypothetical protein